MKIDVAQEELIIIVDALNTKSEIILLSKSYEPNDPERLSVEKLAIKMADASEE